MRKDTTLNVLFLKGLPGSGKSTFAKQLVADHPEKWVRVNKDTLRKLLHDGNWSKGREKIVEQMERAMAEDALKSRLSVVVDNTGFATRHEDTYRQMAERHGATFEVKFFDVPVEQCIERDIKRGDGAVGKDVILRMYYQFMCAKEGPLRDDDSLPSAVICDIDGTLAKMAGRSPFDWSKVGTDTLNYAVAKVLRLVFEHAFAPEILLVSGRDGSCEIETRGWLATHEVGFDHLFMRPAGNSEKDTVIKRRIYEEHIRGKYNIIAVFDDRPTVCRMWRQIGLFVFDCGNGVEF